MILSMERTMFATVISELKSVSMLEIFPETSPCSAYKTILETEQYFTINVMPLHISPQNIYK